MKTILITGATSGIGRHAALHLARRGHHVLATGRRQDALATLKEEAAGLRLDVTPLDVTDETSIDAALAEVDRLTDGHGVDVLLNNAGYGQMGAVLDVSDRLVRRQFDTNVFGLLLLSRKVAPQMIARGSGRILNVSSVGGRVTFPMAGVYHASKYAVEALSDAMRVELAPLGVQVSIIEPGGIDTGFSTAAIDSLPEGAEASPWLTVYEQADEVVARADALSPDPTSVSAAIAHAVDARRPRARYVAPAAYRVVLPILEHLPTWLKDLIVSAQFGLGALRAQASLTTSRA